MVAAKLLDIHGDQEFILQDKNSQSLEQWRHLANSPRSGSTSNNTTLDLNNPPVALHPEFACRGCSNVRRTGFVSLERGKS
jgi:hypothetical protein